MDYFDILLARKLANQGDITTESLSVTANGTYTAPSGKAYTPVNVAVEGYALKALATPSEVASFNAAELPLNKLKIAINAVQSGSGDPSPTNIRPISGWDEANVSDVGEDFFDATGTITQTPSATVTVVNTKTINVKGISTGTYPSSKQLLSEYSLTNGKTYKIRAYASVSSGKPIIAIRNSSNSIIARTDSSATGSGILEMKFTYDSETMNYISFFSNYGEAGGDVTYSDIMFAEVVDTTISLPQTVYGGELDVVNGTSGNRITYAMIDLGDLTWEDADGSGWIQSRVVTNIKTVPNRDIGNLVCEIFGVMSANDVYTKRHDSVISINNNGRLQAHCSQLANITSGVDIRTWMTGHKLVYELATPTTFTTQPTLIKSLNGQNNIYSDTGEVMECEWLEAL